MIELVEVEPGKWRVKRANTHAYLRADLPMPYVISDIMDPVEQVDGRFYTSKREYRAVGKAHGLVEVGNEKPKPRQKLSQSRAASESRRASIRKAVERVRAGNTNSK